MKQTFLVSLLALVALVRCTKTTPVEELLEFPEPTSEVSCIDEIQIIDNWTIEVPLQSSGSNKLFLRNTTGLRTMAYTGNTNTLRNELECYGYSARSVNILKTGHKSDINQIGFAPQLLIEDEWIVAMFHPNNFPDHFIVYNVNTKEWFRYDHSDRDIYIQGTGD